MGATNSYFGHIWEGITSSWQGLKLSMRHIRNAKKSRTPIGIMDENYFEQETGVVTLRYPYESLPVPDNGRYRLHNEMEDCIVCDKCAEICPVNCIDIEAVKSSEEIRKTSDGHSVRLYAARFDIDMAKCCFCGLCTTVCPTECLTMTKTYDFSEFDVQAMNYHFSDLSPDEATTKRQEYEAFQAAKQAAKNTPPVADIPAESEKVAPTSGKPVMKKPMIKPTVTVDTAVEVMHNHLTANGEDTSMEEAPKPSVMKRPVIKPKKPDTL